MPQLTAEEQAIITARMHASELQRLVAEQRIEMGCEHRVATRVLSLDAALPNTDRLTLYDADLSITRRAPTMLCDIDWETELQDILDRGWWHTPDGCPPDLASKLDTFIYAERRRRRQKTA